MPSIDAPPTLAQVQAQHYERDARLTRAEREGRRADLEHAALVERQIELARVAPGVAVAWQLTRAMRMAAVPLHPTTLEPVADPISDPLEVLEHWTANPAHATGVRLGVQRGGAMALVALKCQSWAAWRGWVSEHAVTEHVRPWDEDESRGDVERVPKPLGGPSFVLWQAPAASPFRQFAITKGRRAMDEMADAVRKANAGEDKGGWLCWSVGPVGGRLPTLAHRQLAAGLVVMGSDEVLPLSCRTPQRWTLRQAGGFREPDPVHDCPGWLLEVFGAKWRAV